jgi:hypothetical protein
MQEESLHHPVAMHLHSDEAQRRTAADSAPARAGIHTVQLMPAPEAALLPAAGAAGSQGAWPAGDAAGDQRQPVDVDDLAQKVYRQLRRRLLLEWERLRPVRD